MAEPRVAVIVPCFNDGATVEGTVRSVTAQEECELVVIDDGSDEQDTVDRLERLRQTGVNVIRQDNQGLSAARMRGVAETNARYLLPLDADDVLEPGAITRLADTLDRHPGAALVWGDLKLFGEVSLEQPRARTLDPWLITHVNSLAPGVIRRSALLDARGWHLKVGYEDWDLWMSLAERGWDGIGIGVVTHHYRVSARRMLGRARSSHDELFDQMRKRHDALFAARGRNWRHSPARWWVKLSLPAIAQLPFARVRRHQLALFVVEPVHGLRVRYRRLHRKPRRSAA